MNQGTRTLADPSVTAAVFLRDNVATCLVLYDNLPEMSKVALNIRQCFRHNIYASNSVKQFRIIIDAGLCNCVAVILMMM